MTDSVTAPPQGSDVPASGVGAASSRAGLWGLALGSIGVVYGDIGTSPLYALREAVAGRVRSGTGARPWNWATVLGVVSLILWALFITVTLKYVVILLRADNNGEGGTLTLMALASRAAAQFSGAAPFVALLGIISAALFYGDAVITPALSVLSAVEGVDVATPALHEYVVPVTVVILIALFAVQSRGTAKVAAMFGPIMMVWFVAIALPGLIWIAVNPVILWALNPLYGIYFLLGHGIDRPVHARRGLSRRHRRRGALCRSRPLRPWSDTDRLDPASSCRRSRSIISARARWSSPIPTQSRIHSSCSIPIGR